MSQPIIDRLRAAGCVFAEDEARLLIAAARGPAELADMVERRATGLPLEYILGWAEFCGLRIAVEPGVFVPRLRTEFLVRRAIALAAPGSLVVDLCCGSGALGAAVLASVPAAELYATDLDPVAVRCARHNVPRVYQGDLFEPLPSTLRGRVDVLLANVPYVPSAAVALLPPEARDHEPRVALDGGADGLDVLRRVAAEAASWLAPGGHLLTETSEAQASAAVEVLMRQGLHAAVASSDEATVVIAGAPS